MADDWDLYAVVRSCNAAAATTATSSTNTTRSTTTINNSNISSSSVEKDDDSFPSLDSLTLQNDGNKALFIPGLLDDKKDSFQGFEEICREFCANPLPLTTTTTTTATSITISKELQNQPQPQLPRQSQPTQQQQQGIQWGQDFEFSNAQFDPSSVTFPVASPQPIRPRKRKNQQSKMVRQMTQEELSADSWAWRKYGQKPIKGSPYPRNYYRCSTSKGCAARKQVERSPTDPNIYIVSYTGEHTHPRPTHRSSLAGSTRTKFSPANNNNKSSSSGDTRAGATKTTKTTTILAPKTKPSCSSSSHASGSSFSPSRNTPLIEGEHVQDDDIGMLKSDEEVEADILIPNEFMGEDIFKGFQEINNGPNGSDNSSSGAALGDDHLPCSLLSPPSTPSSSAADCSKFTGGGGGQVAGEFGRHFGHTS